jgi:phosphoribosylformylglycinamidine cyclo-ligase
VTTTARAAYAVAGVNVEAADRALELLRTRLPHIGGFGAAFELPAGYGRPVLVSSTDGVGTKTDIARRLGLYDTIGRDLVAMCVDDVVCHGARPLFFLDYLAVGRVDPARVATIVGGIADACAETGCDLVGGETAEHPGLMSDDEFDLAGFCVGIVEREDLIDGSTASEGDVIVGMASSGLHANGYSLVRRLIDQGRLALSEDLLTPTRLYAPAVLALIAELGDDVHGLAHVTGGGLPGNLPRALRDDLGARVKLDSWPLPEVLDRVRRAAGLDAAELRATFNSGIGMAAIVPPDAAGTALRSLHGSGIEAWVIGEVRSAIELGGRYLEVA